ncbi:hypothetical protein JQ636_27390 [Bradyrhizobium japonicum]|uniref:hypothetical protein n=1 Tax=Bradyrhizobium japonicum TaxID=375 RepID=UPI00138B13CA|nr:hypothetical protein [Bradyrhizobium japonicum]MBR0732632.1 hypothetical protein [Bradyrhizobium japonicum]MBR0807281.1 hypothetical protein [Bradyrhizobium japonicum]
MVRLSRQLEAAMNVIGPKYQRGNEVGVKRPMLGSRSNCPQLEKRDTGIEPCNQPDRD